MRDEASPLSVMKARAHVPVSPILWLFRTFLILPYLLTILHGSSSISPSLTIHEQS